MRKPSKGLASWNNVLLGYTRTNAKPELGNQSDCRNMGTTKNLGVPTKDF